MFFLFQDHVNGVKTTRLTVGTILILQCCERLTFSYPRVDYCHILAFVGTDLDPQEVEYAGRKGPKSSFFLGQRGNFVVEYS
jgi:hypothetical protein